MRALSVGLALAALICLFALAAAQQLPAQDPPKTNSRPAPTPMPRKRVQAEPFDSASAEEMNSQCVTLQTAEGNILIELFADGAPETVRNFLNMSATGLLDTTVFNRVVRDFVIQGGNISVHENLTQAMVDRARRTIPDEPNFVKHERGVVSMARPDAPNSSTTHFFILVRDTPSLDATFTAFGRVRSGMEVVDRINRMDLNGEKPLRPVRINRAVVAKCTP